MLEKPRDVLHRAPGERHVDELVVMAGVFDRFEVGSHGASTLLSLRGSGPGLWSADAAMFVAELREEWE